MSSVLSWVVVKTKVLKRLKDTYRRRLRKIKTFGHTRVKTGKLRR